MVFLVDLQYGQDRRVWKEQDRSKEQARTRSCAGVEGSIEQDRLRVELVKAPLMLIKNYKRRNEKDLARIGLRLKDAMDTIQDKQDVDDATLVGYQVIVQIMNIYLMRRCGNGSNMYVMIHVDDVLIPESLKDFLTIGMDCKLWFELALTVGNGIKPVLDAAAKGTVVAVCPPMGTGKARIRTTSTPDLNKLLRRAQEMQRQ